MLTRHHHIMFLSIFHGFSTLLGTIQVTGFLSAPKTDSTKPSVCPSIDLKRWYSLPLQNGGWKTSLSESWILVTFQGLYWSSGGYSPFWKKYCLSERIPDRLPTMMAWKRGQTSQICNLLSILVGCGVHQFLCHRWSKVFEKLFSRKYLH